MSELKILKDEIKHLKQLQKSLYDIAKVAHEVKDSFTLYSKIHKIIDKYIYTDNIFIALYNKNTDTLRFDYYVDTMDKDFNAGSELKVSNKSVTAYCLEKKETVYKSKKELLKMKKEGIIKPVGSIPETWLGVPLISKNNIVGVITIQSYNSKYVITEKDKDLLIFVSELLAM